MSSLFRWDRVNWFSAFFVILLFCCMCLITSFVGSCIYDLSESLIVNIISGLLFCGVIVILNGMHYYRLTFNNVLVLGIILFIVLHILGFTGNGLFKFIGLFH